MITEIVVSVLIVCASIFMVLAAIGLVKFPDLPTRMHATTKSGVLAICLIMVAVGLHFSQTEITARVIAIISFILITAPVAAHAIGRAAYFAGVPLWPGTTKDELKDYYSLEPSTEESSEPNTENSLEPSNEDSLESSSENSPELSSENNAERSFITSPKENLKDKKTSEQEDKKEP